jgi:hypothetical protein
MILSDTEYYEDLREILSLYKSLYLAPIRMIKAVQAMEKDILGYERLNGLLLSKLSPDELDLKLKELGY